MSDFSLTLRKAKELEKNRTAACRIRIRYLDQWASDCLNDGSPVALFWAAEALEEICYLTQRMYSEPVQNAQNWLTDDLIAQAKAYPIQNLITFSKGKAKAWCHDDRTPSLSWNQKKNKAHCFVCGKSFDPIAVLVERDGYSFKEAVKVLT